MFWGVMFIYVVGGVTVSRCQVDKKFILVDTVTHLVKEYVDQFDSFRVDAGVDETNLMCATWIRVDGWGMSHFDEGESNGKGVVGGEEGGTDLRFCG